MKSDSVIYNTETKFARFFENSEIWNIDDEYLSADAGYYDNSQNLYVVTKNGYILTEEQVMWGDTLSYYRDNEHIIAYNNIQMDDIENKVLAFSDYAEYWGDKDIALLTRKPVLRRCLLLYRQLLIASLRLSTSETSRILSLSTRTGSGRCC